VPSRARQYAVEGDANAEAHLFENGSRLRPGRPGGCRAAAGAADANIELAPADAGPVIDPNLYGHFIEHLGGVIYDGIWVGRGSKIPSVDGIRKQFVDDIRGLGAPNLRWPGISMKRSGTRFSCATPCTPRWRSTSSTGMPASWRWLT
jgi:hypothetical protein